MDADFVLGLCDRFKCLPSQLLAEDADLLRMIVIQEKGTRRESAPAAQEG